MTPPTERCSPEMAALVERYALAIRDAAQGPSGWVTAEQAVVARAAGGRVGVTHDVLLAAIANLEAAQAEAERKLAASVAASASLIRDLLAALSAEQPAQAEADRKLAALVGAVEARLIAASITADEMDRAPCGVCGSFAPRFKKWIDDFGADVRAALPKDPTP